MPSPTDDETAFPAFDHDVGFNGFGRSHLSPDDAFAPPLPGTSKHDTIAGIRSRVGERSQSRRRKRGWKKLMWLRQPCTFILLSSRRTAC